jgi:hypothetical protein
MNWFRKTAQNNIFDLRKDGKLLLRGTEADCYKKLQQVQSQSADWAMKYEGYTITPINADWKDSYQWYAPER